MELNNDIKTITISIQEELKIDVKQFKLSEIIVNVENKYPFTEKLSKTLKKLGYKNYFYYYSLDDMYKIFFPEYKSELCIKS